MHDRVKRTGMSFIVAMFLLGGVCLSVSAQQGDDSKILSLFEQGMEHYEARDYAKAEAAFTQVLSMRPSMSIALQMRQKAEVEQFADMMTNEDLAPVAERVVKLMRWGTRSKKRDVTNIDALLEDFQSTDLQTYGGALNKIMGHGPYAIPYLLDFLSLKGKANHRIVVRTKMAISNMHEDVVYPLVAALGTNNDLLKTRLIELLGEVGDRKAVPALLSVTENEQATDLQREAARESLKKLTDIGKLGAPLQEYGDLAEAYLKENHDMVGYFDAAQGEVWMWDEGASKLQNKLTYRMVPNYLYFPAIGVRVALNGLELDPNNERLRALMVAMVTVQMSRCKMVSSDNLSAQLGEDMVTDAMKSDAADRLTDLEERWPLLCRMAGPGVVGRAVELALDAGASPAALDLVQILGTKSGLTRKQGGDSLLRALDAGDKRVRYHAAIQAVRHAPLGEFGDARKVMKVMSATLKGAAAKTALLIVNDLNIRNKLAFLIRNNGLSTVGCSAIPSRVNKSLNLQPSVDIIFVTADVPPARYERVHTLLKQDVRTQSIPLYVLAGDSAVNVSDYSGISGVLSPAQVRADKINSLLQQQVLEQRNAGDAERSEELLMAALKALEPIQPEATDYPLGRLETALLDSLRGYSEDLELVALRVLATIGSYEAVQPIGKIVDDQESSAELKVQACKTIASILRRTGKVAPAKTVGVLQDALGTGSKKVREAAAEALGAAGLKSSEELEYLSDYAEAAS